MKANYLKGFDFQIRPVVSFDSKNINLDLISNHILQSELIPHEFKTQNEKESSLGIKMDGQLSGSGEAEKNETKDIFSISITYTHPFYFQSQNNFLWHCTIARAISYCK